MLDSEKTVITLRSEQILKQENASIKDVFFITKGRSYSRPVKQRHKTPIELSLFTVKKFYFDINAQTTLTQSVVTLVCLLAICEVNLNNFVIMLTQRVIS